MTVTINGTTGVTSPEVTLDNSSADGGQVVLKSSGYSNWNWDNYSGRLRAYYGSTEYFTVDASGNVGIGTSSPPSFTNYTSLRVGSSSSKIGLISIYDGTTDIQITPSSGVGYAGTASNSAFGFLTNNTERMRIDSSGNLLVGCTSLPSASVPGSGFWAADGDVGRRMLRMSSSFTGFADLVYFFNPNGLVGAIGTSGSSTIYSTSSDYRLKENIQPMQNALGVVAQLNPVTYTWKADGSDGQGFIAHELQAVVPDCVTGEKDAVDAEGKPVYQGIDTSFLVATLTKAIQELSAKNDALEARLAALEAK